MKEQIEVGDIVREGRNVLIVLGVGEKPQGWRLEEEPGIVKGLTPEKNLVKIGITTSKALQEKREIFNICEKYLHEGSFDCDKIEEDLETLKKLCGVEVIIKEKKNGSEENTKGNS